MTTNALKYLSQAFLPTPIDSGLNILAQHLDEMGQMSDILHAAVELLDIELTDTDKAIIEHVSSMAEMPHDGMYHSTKHFREAVSCLAFLINRSEVKIAKRNQFLLLIAGAAHDLKHDGTGNTINGKHKEFRLEDASFEAIGSTLSHMGMSKKDLETIHTLLRSTDVSKNPNSEHHVPPAVQVRFLDRAHIMHSGPTDVFNCLPQDNFLGNFRGNPELWHMAKLIQAADILPSSALSLVHSMRNSVKLEVENSNIPATVNSFKGFAKFIAEPALSALPGHLGQALTNRLKAIISDMSATPGMRFRPV